MMRVEPGLVGRRTHEQGVTESSCIPTQVINGHPYVDGQKSWSPAVSNIAR